MAVSRRINLDHVTGAAIGALLTAGAIFMPYERIASTMSWDMGFGYPVALALAMMSGVVLLGGRKGSVVLAAPFTERDAGSALALKPIEWLERHDILAQDGMEGMVAKIDATFSNDLRSMDDLPLVGWRRLLATCLASYATSELVDGKRPEKVLADMRETALRADGDLDLRMNRLSEACTASPVASALLKDLVGKHGQLETYLMGALAAARAKGAMPSGMFAWVKQVDRHLWYAMSNLGRGAHHVEGAAAIAHYEEELAQGKALKVRHIARASLAMFELARHLTAPVEAEAA